MKTACIVARAHSAHQQSWGGAFAAGLRRHGWITEVSEQPIGCDLMVLWGVRRREEIERQKKRGEVCILERGYLGDRMHWTSVSFGGGLNGRAEFRGVRDDPDRFKRHFGEMIQPWKPREGYALLIGQVAGDMSLASVNGSLSAWYRDTAAALQRQGYDVRFRPHPGTVRRGMSIMVPRGAKVIGGSLADALTGAALVATFNSNTGVESVLAGCPTITMDEGAMAWPVTSHEIGEVVTPDREAWAAALAWKQWTLAEMASGECWAHVGQA